MTTLPLHYCYGLSVLHCHLAVGASVLLTDASVVDAALWSSMRAAGVTSLSGVPHTFDLLESSRRTDGHPSHSPRWSPRPEGASSPPGCGPGPSAAHARDGTCG